MRDLRGPEQRVSLQTAAERTGVPLATLEAWKASGALDVERHGRGETVLLNDVLTLVSWEGHRRPDALRNRLRDATAEATRGVTELQRIVRDR